ncbi:MAG TPA: DUF6600 domain-containing protein [Chthoniobacterales bacterium]|nr:DUF6600 domain-containing protein [Chthoniobacterales bacterium]
MKRILLAVAILALVLPAMRQAEARVDVSIDFFYDNIGSDGNWVEVADYGYCWQPTVAVSNAKWRPYSDGYWVYTDVGWTWVSNEDFGWATYHYGRWTRLRDRGWFWVPGREWGPAWVSWRTGGDYVGWAPLPPRGRGDVDYDNRTISGQVDVEFDIGPSYYNFVDVRYIGEPVLRERIVESSLNITYISNTVNVTNITYTNSRVHNYGPDYDTVSRYSTRPIRRMTLEHDANADLSVAVRSRGVNRVQGDRLIVAAPLTFQKPPKPIAPKMVKEKIAKPTFERGWDGVSDPKAQEELKQKMKSEDPKKIPPPSIKPRDGAEPALSPAGASPAAPAPGSTQAPAATSPAVSGSPASVATPATAASPVAPSDDKGKGKDKDKPAKDLSASPNPASMTSPAMTPADKPKRERGDKPAPALTPSSSVAPGSTPAPRITAPPLPASTPPREVPGRDKDKKDKRTEKAPDVMPQTRQPPDAQIEKPPRKPKDESIPAPPPSEVQRESPPKRNLPPEQPVPVRRETPPPTSQKPPPAERMAPPPGPATSKPEKPEKAEQAPSKRPDKKATEPAPSPGG